MQIATQSLFWTLIKTFRYKYLKSTFRLCPVTRLNRQNDRYIYVCQTVMKIWRISNKNKYNWELWNLYSVFHQFASFCLWRQLTYYISLTFHSYFHPSKHYKFPPEKNVPTKVNFIENNWSYLSLSIIGLHIIKAMFLYWN